MAYFTSHFFRSDHFASHHFGGRGVVPPPTPTPSAGGAGSIGAIVFSDRKKRRPNIAYDPRLVGVGELAIPLELLSDEVLKKAKLKRGKRRKRLEYEEIMLFNDFDLIAAELEMRR